MAGFPIGALVKFPAKWEGVRASDFGRVAGNQPTDKSLVAILRERDGAIILRKRNRVRLVLDHQ